MKKTNWIITQELDFEKAEKALDDHSKLMTVLSVLPAQKLFSHLDAVRKGRREKSHPTIFLWNCFIVMMVYRHPTFESLRRELMRNRDLRFACFGRNDKNDVASPSSFSRFLKKLSARKSQAILDDMFKDIIAKLREKLPGFGQKLAGDSTEISSLSNGIKKKETGQTSDPDASWRKYEMKHIADDGNVMKSSKKWFGYKLHLLVDAIYELPLGYAVTSANVNDDKPMRAIVDDTLESHPDMKPETIALDGAYDTNENHKHFLSSKILPVIHQNKRARKEPEGIFNMDGVPACVNGFELCYKGRDGDFLKYVCPNGKTLSCIEKCDTKVVKLKVGKDGDFVNYRALPTHTKKFEREYKKRTAVERVFARYKDGWGQERMNVLWIAKTKAMISISLLCMVSFALAMAGQKRESDIRKYASLCDARRQAA